MEFNQNTRSTNSRTGNLKKLDRPLADVGKIVCSKTEVCGALEGSVAAVC
jgi:hypothetical protein